MVTLPFFKLVKSGLALAPGTKPPARASILYVEDAAGALLAGVSAPHGAVYEVADERPEGWAWTEIGAALGEVFGRRTRPIAVPRRVIAAYHGAVRTVEGALGRGPSVREGQINEFFHPDWVARDNLLSEATAWRPTTPLKEGFAKTACWYQERGLL
jgi:nucleoside-diphosphate-sugar epimerase